jgi:hypothetical protein
MFILYFIINPSPKHISLILVKNCQLNFLKMILFSLPIFLTLVFKLANISQANEKTKKAKIDQTIRNVFEESFKEKLQLSFEQQ